MGYGNECHCIGVSSAVFHLLLLSDGEARRQGDNELEHCHVWGHYNFCYGMVCAGWEGDL